MTEWVTASSSASATGDGWGEWGGSGAVNVTLHDAETSALDPSVSVPPSVPTPVTEGVGVSELLAAVFPRTINPEVGGDFELQGDLTSV
jgi:hypothetical protein